MALDKKTPMTDKTKPALHKGYFVACLGQTRVTDGGEAVRLLTLAQELYALKGNRWDIEQDTDFDLVERAVGANAAGLPLVAHGSLFQLFKDAREAAKNAETKSTKAKRK